MYSSKMIAKLQGKTNMCIHIFTTFENKSSKNKKQNNSKHWTFIKCMNHSQKTISSNALNQLTWLLRQCRISLKDEGGYHNYVYVLYEIKVYHFLWNYTNLRFLKLLYVDTLERLKFERHWPTQTIDYWKKNVTTSTNALPFVFRKEKQKFSTLKNQISNEHSLKKKKRNKSGFTSKILTPILTL